MASAEQYAQWIVSNQDKKGTPEFETVAQAYRLAKDPNSKYKAMQKVETIDPTKEMNILETGAAGLGKMMVDTGRGVKQIVGAGDQQTIDNEAQLSKNLMNTWGGNIGNIAGHVGLSVLPGGAAMRAGQAMGAPGVLAAGRAMLAPSATIGGIATGVGMGATQGALQAVPTGDSRLRNSIIGGVGGGLVPTAGMAVGAVRGAVQPLYEGGRQRIVGDALRRATGQNVNDVIRNLDNAPVLVPGSLPTAAEVGNSGGLAAMQRAASAVDPEAYATRAAQQNEARVGALMGMAGTQSDRAQMAGVRGMMSEVPYEEAVKTGIPKDVAKAASPLIENLLERPAMKKAIARAKDIFGEESIDLSKSGSVKGLQYTKQALDDMIERAGSPGSSIGKNELRALKQTRGDLIAVLEELSPKLREADKAFAQWSRPINQMDVAQQLADKSINKLTGVMQPQSFARNLNDDLAAGATGFNRSTLENTMEPHQIAKLNALRDDLARSVAARDMGRGAGSDTVQKLAMTNLMQQSGLPVGLLSLPGIGRVGNFAYSQADDLMKRQLAEILLNPQMTAAVMRGAAPDPVIQGILENMRRVAAPGILGLTTGLNAPQQ
jgi:hypothetical protein